MITFVKCIANGKLSSAILTSLITVITGVGIAIVFGLVFGISCFAFPSVKKAVMPILDMMRPLSALAMMPIFIVLFGLGFTVKVIVIFWTAWAPIVLNTYHGLESVDKNIIEAGKLDGAGRSGLLTHIMLPLAFPTIMTGFNISISSGWISIVAAEMLGGNNGLGFMILQSAETFRYDEMYIAIVSIAVIGLTMVTILKKLQRTIENEKDFFAFDSCPLSADNDDCRGKEGCRND